MKYIALLRGINVGGNNKVPMKDLKDCFVEAGAENAQTYINSGNVIFDYDENKFDDFVILIEQILSKKFNFNIGLFFIGSGQLKEALDSVPDWWDQDPQSKHNAIFVMPPFNAQQVVENVGEATQYEKIFAFKQIVFWSASLDYLSRTKWAKAHESKSYKHITIRNANTAKKLLELALNSN